MVVELGVEDDAVLLLAMLTLEDPDAEVAEEEAMELEEPAVEVLLAILELLEVPETITAPQRSALPV